MAFWLGVFSLFNAVDREPVKEDNTMRIMSFNILCYGEGEDVWTKRINAVTGTIKAAAPDSFGVQEATPEWMTALKAALPMYACVGVGRDDGKNKGEHSAVFYLRAKYKASDAHTFWLSETPEKPSFGWEAACRRICTYVLLENRGTGERYIHANTHLDHVSAAARSEGVRLITERLSAFGDVPCVLTGDFNATEDSEVYRAVTGGVFADSKYLAADSMEGRTFHNFAGEGAGSPIDFVFVTREHFDVAKYTIMNQKIGDRYASDHFALYADIAFK